MDCNKHNKQDINDHLSKDDIQNERKMNLINIHEA